MYHEYSVTVSTDPTYYGSECSPQDAVRIASNIASLIRGEFPGIDVRIGSDIGGRGVTGPDDAIVRQIEDWISTNWTTAL